MRNWEKLGTVSNFLGFRNCSLSPISHLLRGAGRGVPPGRIGEFSEVRACDERLVQIHRVINDRRNDEIVVAVGLLGDVEVLRDNRIAAIRNTVFAQVSGPHHLLDSRRNRLNQDQAHDQGHLRGREASTLPRNRFVQIREDL